MKCHLLINNLTSNLIVKIYTSFLISYIFFILKISVIFLIQVSINFFKKKRFLRMFPYLVNSCIILWLNPWSDDSLTSIGCGKLEEYNPHLELGP